MLQTPTTTIFCESPEQMRARAERNGYKNGTQYNSLESQVMYDPKVAALLPTPTARDEKNPSSPDGERIARKREQGYTIELNDLAPMGLLPMPITRDWKGHGTAPRKDTGKLRTDSLDGLAALDMLPTPSARDYKGKTNPGVVKEGSGCVYGETLPDTVSRVCAQKKDGQTFRLSPLFTEEMMGFPFLWTTLPFLRQDGAPSPSKPTATR